jgi:P27 family predicted phage terminase small subunit
MKGRKPKPTALKIAEGNPGKWPLNHNEPKPTPGAPACPKHLSGESRKEWERLAPELDRMGLLTLVDLAALAGYCESWGSYLNALAKMKKGGEVVLGSEGQEIKSKWRIIADDQKRIIHKFLSEFGLTPSSRARLAVKPPTTPVDELQEFIKG